MKLKPIYDNVVLKRESGAEMTKGGLHLPETGRDQPARGEVVAVGEGEPLDDGSFRKHPVKVGDRILFRKYAASDITIGEEGFTLVRIADVIGLIEDEPKTESKA